MRSCTGDLGRSACWDIQTVRFQVTLTSLLVPRQISCGEKAAMTTLCKGRGCGAAHQKCTVEDLKAPSPLYHYPAFHLPCCAIILRFAYFSSMSLLCPAVLTEYPAVLTLLCLPCCALFFRALSQRKVTVPYVGPCPPLATP